MEKQKTLLVYDDEEDILEVLCLVLSPEYKVHTFTRIRNITDEAVTLEPDIILMDLRIPEIGGLKATTYLKSDERTKHIPVILFSANNNIQTIAKDAKADGYISKPFQIAHLKESLQRFAFVSR